MGKLDKNIVNKMVKEAREGEKMKSEEFKKVIHISIFLLILSIYTVLYLPGLNIIVQAFTLIFVFLANIYLLLWKRSLNISKYLLFYSLFIFVCLISVLVSDFPEHTLNKVISLFFFFHLYSNGLLIIDN